MCPTSCFHAKFPSLINDRGEAICSCVDGWTPPWFMFAWLPPADISDSSAYLWVFHPLVRHFWTDFIERMLECSFRFHFLSFFSIHLRSLVFTQHSPGLVIHPPFCHVSNSHPKKKKLFLLQVTQDPRMVLPLQWEELMDSEGSDLQLVFSSMAKQIQSLLAQRDLHLEVFKHTHQWRTCCSWRQRWKHSSCIYADD